MTKEGQSKIKKFFTKKEKKSQKINGNSKNHKKIINTLIKNFYIKYPLKKFQYKQLENQEKIFHKLIKKGKKTSYGKTYGFEDIHDINDFQKQVPLNTYKSLEPRILRALKGEKNVLYPGKTQWFATSSGTTGLGKKYIPVTNDSLKESHYRGSQTLMSFYCKNNPKSKFFEGKCILIGGNFDVNPYTGKNNVGFITAILQKNAPKIAQYFKEPNPQISYIENREIKAEKTIQATLSQNITGISGSPSWCSNFLFKVLEITKKENILEVWPNFKFFVRGGMSLDLYKNTFEELIPSSDMIYYQAYNASEGFFAVQNENNTKDMILLTNHGTFYEFIPLEELGKRNPTVLTLDQVETEKNYAILVSTNTGLRRYKLGDTIKFTSTNPYKIIISGRTKYFLNVTGERLTTEQTDKALIETCKKTGAKATEYTAGPIAPSKTNKGANERIIEFTETPKDLKKFTNILDKELGKISSYYYDERHETDILGEPIIHATPEGTFYKRLKSKNKLGGQFKVPKLANHRTYLEEILTLIK